MAILPVMLGFSRAVHKTTVTALPVLGTERPKAKKMTMKPNARAIQSQHANIQLRLRRRHEGMKKHKHRSNSSPRDSVQKSRLS